MENLGPQATNALQFAAFADMTEDRVERDRLMSADERKGKLSIGSHLSSKQRASYSRPSSAFGSIKLKTDSMTFNSPSSTDYASAPHQRAPKTQPLVNDSIA